MPHFLLEEGYAAQGYRAIAGVDEAGRGPLSGPVFAAAVILPRDAVIPGLDDSKKLSEKKREQLFDMIIANALSYAIASASPQEIDRLNILNATMLAMRRALEALPLPPDFALVDGNCVRNLPVPAAAVVGGDALSCSIAAASILAKVSRDRRCYEDDRLYPLYGFAAHKGYGTAGHMAALRALGPCPLHRKTFLKFLERP
ncbi:MAG: ribonuclease HII [Eubacteriales bacterium]